LTASRNVESHLLNVSPVPDGRVCEFFTVLNYSAPVAVGAPICTRFEGWVHWNRWESPFTGRWSLDGDCSMGGADPNQSRDHDGRRGFARWMDSWFA